MVSLRSELVRKTRLAKWEPHHLERYGVWNTNWQIGKDGKSFVRLYAFERQIMCDLVNGKK